MDPKWTWLQEKAEYSGYYAARLVDKINLLPISEENRQRLYIELHPLLYNLMKVIAYACDATDGWKPNMAERIIDTGTEGYKTAMHCIWEHSERGCFMNPDDIVPANLKGPI